MTGMFVLMTLVLGMAYIFLRNFFSSSLQFSWWPILLWAGIPFSIMLFATDVSPLVCLPSIGVGIASGYILEKLSIQKRPTSQSAPGLHHSTSSLSSAPAADKEMTSSHIDTSDISSGDDNDFGGGTFSGGGGTSTW